MFARQVLVYLVSSDRKLGVYRKFIAVQNLQRGRNTSSTSKFLVRPVAGGIYLCVFWEVRVDGAWKHVKIKTIRFIMSLWPMPFIIVIQEEQKEEYL